MALGIAQISTVGLRRVLVGDLAVVLEDLGIAQISTVGLRRACAYNAHAMTHHHGLGIAQISTVGL